MTERPESDPPEADVAAAELALGLLEGDDRAAALRRMLAEPAFAREVERWRAHLANLFAIVPEVSPSAELGDRVVDRLDGRDFVPAPARAGRWKAFSLISSLAAASLLGLLLIRPEPGNPPLPPAVVQPAPLVAAFTVEGQKTPVVAVYDSARGTVRMPGPMDIGEGKSAQLWAIVGNQPPRPLGTFHSAGPDLFEAEARGTAPIAAGTTLAISIEPRGGSPTGLPTGPVIASGALARI